jgi:methyl-accepting chemotaxis protein
MSTKSLSISAKLWLIAAVAILSSFVLLAFNSWESRNNLIESRQNELKHIVEVAMSTTEFYHAQIPQITEKEAKAKVKAVLSKLRYDNGTGYVWVNDFSARIVMHPIKPQLDGQNASGFKDAKGMRIFSEFARVARADGEGVVDYYWEKPGEAEPIEKSSYVKAFKPWGWVIGTGVYIDDINKTFYSNVLESVGFFIALIIVIFVVIVMIRQDLNSATKTMISAMNRIAQGQLSVRLATTDRKDELGELSVAANEIVSSFEETFKQIKDTMNELTADAGSAEKCGREIHQSVENQFMETDSLSAAMEEMAASVTQVAGNTQSSSQSAQAMNSFVQSSQRQMHETLGMVESLTNQITDSGSVMAELETYTSQISSVLDVIRGISEQTNLLALNAAIEAARAGESGRGFAVVADEVRSLAQKTQECTEEIQTTTEQLKESSANAISVMQSSANLSTDCLELTRETDNNLTEILQQVGEISDLNIQVASATHQQSCVSEEISHNLTELRKLAESLKGEAKGAASVSINLHLHAEQLQQSIAKFS